MKKEWLLTEIRIVFFCTHGRSVEKRSKGNLKKKKSKKRVISIGWTEILRQQQQNKINEELSKKSLEKRERKPKAKHKQKKKKNKPRAISVCILDYSIVELPTK